ncbi:RDD family protein [Rhodococcus sp. NPDC058521]|uniref:RDD family protein n=1 Tax=Rhodococcus sp. NPDC058521 TaxID=3346536 RepID=UPI0036544A9E
MNDPYQQPQQFGPPPQQQFGYQPQFAPPPQFGHSPQFGHPPQQFGYQPHYGAVPPNPYANWGQRVLAYVMDGLPVFGLYMLLRMLGAVFTMTGPWTDTKRVTAVVLVVVILIAMAGFSFWNIAFKQGRTGSTVGKKIVGIKVISETTGQPLGVGMSVVRGFAHIADSFACGLGYLWPLWDGKRQTFADKIVGSVVIPFDKNAPAGGPDGMNPRYPPTVRDAAQFGSTRLLLT